MSWPEIIYEKRDAAPYRMSSGPTTSPSQALSPYGNCLVLDRSPPCWISRARSLENHPPAAGGGLTIVSITHYMEEAAQADRVLVMSRGRIVMEGTPEQVFSQTEKLHSYHLDVPQAAELRDELVKAGIPMPENVITPEACAEDLFKLLK
ncbi:hypothetical protein [Gemmiger formicilis]|uniref:hypothetical protein n=1 Tax=Gemmiger formicilis TaxID=745368 RepID=UPI003CCB72CA